MTTDENSIQEKKIFREKALKYHRQNIPEAIFPKSMQPYVLKTLFGLFSLMCLILISFFWIEVPVYMSADGIFVEQEKSGIQVVDAWVLKGPYSKEDFLGRKIKIIDVVPEVILEGTVVEVGDSVLTPFEISQNAKWKILEKATPKKSLLPIKLNVALKKSKDKSVGFLKGISCSIRIEMNSQKMRDLVKF